MGKRILKYTVIIIGITLLFSLDFLRDYFFKNVQFQAYYISHLDNNQVSSVENYTDSLLEPLLSGLSITDLFYLKWIGSAFFITLFAVTGALLNFFVYYNKKVFVYFFSLYGFLTVIAVLIYGIIYLTNNYEQQNRLYLTSMQIAHFLQSSLPSLLFLVSFKLYQDSANNGN